MSQVPAEGHKVVTHATDTTHTLLTHFLIFSVIVQQMTSLYVGTNVLFRLYLGHKRRNARTGFICGMQPRSFHGTGIFVKVHARVVTHIRYIWYKFRYDRPIITRTLHEHQKSVFSAQF